MRFTKSSAKRGVDSNKYIPQKEAEKFNQSINVTHVPQENYTDYNTKNEIEPNQQ